MRLLLTSEGCKSWPPEDAIQEPAPGVLARALGLVAGAFFGVVLGLFLSFCLAWALLAILHPLQGWRLWDDLVSFLLFVGIWPLLLAGLWWGLHRSSLPEPIAGILNKVWNWFSSPGRKPEIPGLLVGAGLQRRSGRNPASPRSIPRPRSGRTAWRELQRWGDPRFVLTAELLAALLVAVGLLGLFHRVSPWMWRDLPLALVVHSGLGAYTFFETAQRPPRLVRCLVLIFLLAFLISSVHLSPPHRHDLNNETGACGALRTIHAAQEDYRQRSPGGTYANSLGKLATGEGGGRERLMDDALGAGLKSGYRFNLRVGGFLCPRGPNPGPNQTLDCAAVLHSATQDENLGAQAAGQPEASDPSCREERERTPPGAAAEKVFQELVRRPSSEEFGLEAIESTSLEQKTTACKADLQGRCRVHGQPGAYLCWEAEAHPVQYRRTGRRSFFIDQDGVLRGEDLHGEPGPRQMPEI